MAYGDEYLESLIRRLNLRTPQESGNSVLLTKTEIERLRQKAANHATYDGLLRQSALCVWFYRNKTRQYFDDVYANHGGLMEVYIKDNSGDRRSPINGRIKGLFFMAGVEPGSTTGLPKHDSAFGSTRLLVPANDLLEKAPNLYFADFYCMRNPSFHYVTLVMTKPGSVADKFCADHILLLPMSLNDSASNPFLFYNASGELQVCTRSNLSIELLFTENLDITPYRYTLQHNTPLIGKGCTTPGGVPKNSSGQCSLCRV